jgi:hypothetical protein
MHARRPRVGLQHGEDVGTEQSQGWLRDPPVVASLLIASLLCLDCSFSAAAASSRGTMAQLPPGYVMAPAVVDNSHKRYDVAAAITAMLILTTAITVARVWSKFRARLMGLEDWSIIPALVCLNAQQSVTARS